LLEAKEELARQIVLVECQKTIINLAIFRDLARIHFEHIPDIVKINQPPSDVVLESTDPVEKPIEAVPDVNNPKDWLFGWIVSQGCQHV
jgi:hypothetical protein